MENELLKNGDKLYCHKSCIMNDTNDITTTVDKWYFIISVTHRDYIIIDDNWDRHYFPIEKYEKFFCSEKS